MSYIICNETQLYQILFLLSVADSAIYPPNVHLPFLPYWNNSDLEFVGFSYCGFWDDTLHTFKCTMWHSSYQSYLISSQLLGIYVKDLLPWHRPHSFLLLVSLLCDACRCSSHFASMSKCQRPQTPTSLSYTEPGPAVTYFRLLITWDKNKPHI